MNITSFYARCIQNDLTDADDDENRRESSCLDISNTLDIDRQPGIILDSKILVESQFILLCGRSLAVDCFKDVKKLDESRNQWRRWAKKFGKISEEESGETRLSTDTERARKNMIYLHPDFFCN